MATVGFLAGGLGFKGTVERRVADLPVPVVFNEELGRERDARAEGEPETDMGRLAVVERAGPVDIFEEGNEARKLGGTGCTARYTPFGSNKPSSNEVDNKWWWEAGGGTRTLDGDSLRDCCQSAGVKSIAISSVVVVVVGAVAKSSPSRRMRTKKTIRTLL